MSNNTVRVANPLHGGSPYTSRRRATDYVLRGRARFVDDNTIEFFDDMTIRMNRYLERQQRMNFDAVDPHRQIYWNGTGEGMYRPGEVRS